jgi:hypothetical protein
VAVRCRNATRRRSSSVKMATPLATCTKEELASVICFLSSEGVKHIEIHRQMKVQCGDACLLLQQVYEWTRKFMNGISSVTESPRPGARVAVLSGKRIFFYRYSCTSKALEHSYERQWRLHRKMKSLCTFCVQ